MTEQGKVQILGCKLDRLDMREAVARIAAMLTKPGCHQVITLNAEIIYQARQEPTLQQMINQADLVTPDGAGVVWAARYLGSPVRERVTGIDLVAQLAAHGAKEGWRFYLLGSAPGVADEAVNNMISRYPGLQIVGTEHGYFDHSAEAGIIQAINQSGAQILLVGLGAPRQDYWIAEHKGELNCQVAMGVGGSFDVLANKLKRAPQWMIKLNLEWLYRLLKEPSRWRRQLALPRFVGLVLNEKRKMSS